MSSSSRKRFILAVTAGYVVFGLAWIFLSDQLLAAFTDVGAMLWLSTWKGVLFVLASAALFHVALRALPAADAGNAPQTLEALAAGLVPGGMPRWASYAFAIAVSLLMLLIRDAVAVQFDERPLLILFMLPIVLAALFGGFGPGFTATLVCAVGVAYLVIPPQKSLHIAESHDVLQWVFLIGSGTAVSVLTELLRRAMAKVELNRRLLDTVISGTSDAVFIKDREGRYLLANRATGEFVGVPAGQMIGRDDRMLFPEDSAQALQGIDRAIMESGQIQTHEEDLRTTDGRAFVFHVTKGPVHDNTGQVIGLFGISRDITARKQAEAQILHLNADLERRVAERTKDLELANIELQNLAYALTHNLNAPLRAINGFAQLLRESHGSTLDAEGRDCLDQILLASRSMGALMDGILALLRCVSGPLREQEIDLSALAAAHLATLAQAEPQRTVAWTVEPGLAVRGDVAMLKIALEHLIDNAWKFTRGRADARITVGHGSADGQPGLCIADNGAGFDMAHSERLFQPFQRLHRQEEFPGIGIGLATVQRIVRRHGGSIHATATPGQGARFCLALPGLTASPERLHE